MIGDDVVLAAVHIAPQKSRSFCREFASTSNMSEEMEIGMAHAEGRDNGSGIVVQTRLNIEVERR